MTITTMTETPQDTNSNGSNKGQNSSAEKESCNIKTSEPDQEGPSTVLKLSNILSLSILQTEDKFLQVETDIQQECSQHARGIKLILPRPNYLLT